MNYWLETNSTYHEREGRYLIAPFNTEYTNNNPIYKIMEEIKSNDIVFHYKIYKEKNLVNEITSFSKVKNKFYIKDVKDELCTYDPPYRIIDLIENKRLKKPINLESLLPYQSKIEKICKKYSKGRTPFDKNFYFKQLYISRIPHNLIDIFNKISKINQS